MNHCICCSILPREVLEARLETKTSPNQGMNSYICVAPLYICYFIGSGFYRAVRIIVYFSNYNWKRISKEGHYVSTQHDCSDRHKADILNPVDLLQLIKHCVDQVCFYSLLNVGCKFLSFDCLHVANRKGLTLSIISCSLRLNQGCI